MNRVAEELMDGTFLSEKAALKLLTDLCVENSRKLFSDKSHVIIRRNFL